MIKLVSVNMEGARHIPRIHGLIVREQPECIALQEAPESFITDLQELGYHTAFAKMQNRTENGIEANEGVLIGTKRRLRRTKLGPTSPKLSCKKPCSRLAICRLSCSTLM